MRLPLTAPATLAVLVAAATPAAALAPAKHREILETACIEVGLPNALCRRAGLAAFETDYHEWETLAAHAQREAGQDRCVAADAATARVDALARSLVAAADREDWHEAGTALGRALHTIQDECAHRGMFNEEHAFYSLHDVCSHDEDRSPDVQPEAIACAEARTRDVMWIVADVLLRRDLTGALYACRDLVNDDACTMPALVGPVEVCRFLALHDDWDGADSTWNTAIVGAALVDAFAAGIGGTAQSTSVCGVDRRAIDPTAPHPVEVDRDDPGCLLTSAGCLGKLDGDTDPYDDDDDTDDPYADGVGCSGSRSTGWLVVLALALVALRVGNPVRRSARRPARRARTCSRSHTIPR
jgi:hypothetical protein